MNLNETVTARNKFGTYCVSLSTAHKSPPATRAMAGQVYELETINYIMSNCGNGDIIHAGTYFGDFLPALSSACSKDSIVWAFEPKVEHFECAEETLRINNITNVKLYNFGLGSTAENRVLQIVQDDGRVWGGGSRIVEIEKPKKLTEDITVVPIDSMVPHDRNVSILHLDVEGFEIYALIGAMKTIKRCLPILILETVPGNKWLNENILGLGYKIKNTLNGNTILTIG